MAVRVAPLIKHSGEHNLDHECYETTDTLSPDMWTAFDLRFTRPESRGEIFAGFLGRIDQDLTIQEFGLLGWEM
jgi:hypothetical protein